MQRVRGHNGLVIDGPDTALQLLLPRLRDATHERLLVAHLDPATRLIGLFEQSAADGGLVDLPIRGIVKQALLAGTAELILAHNHPSGDPNPTAADCEAMRILVNVTRPLGINVRDHWVVVADRALSFRELGLL